MPLKRDYEGLREMDERGYLYVLFNTETGKIVGGTYSYPQGIGAYHSIACLSPGDYRWLVSRHVPPKVTTASDWYDQIDFKSILSVANVKL